LIHQVTGLTVKLQLRREPIMSLIKGFDEWLDQLPDEDIDGFEDMAHELGVKWAKEHNDEQALTCLTSFSGDNPREYAEDAVESDHHKL
jgi:hypothetical protein